VGGLPTALAFGIGLSASGFPFYASDTGGYRNSPPNNETWLRWVEANAVWPAMQVGDSSAQMPWEFTAENGRTQQSLDTYRRYARLHLQLFPYVWSHAEAMRTTGRPIVRPLGLAYPQLDEHPADQYLLGDSLLVAPVIEAGKTARAVVLPPGDWLDWWTGQPYTAGTQTIAADLHTLPLFVARGGIVPMLRDTIDTLAPATGAIESYANDPGELLVRVAGGPPSSFTLFDGTVIETGNAADLLTFSPGTRFARGVLFEVIGRASGATTVRADGIVLTPRASLAALQGAIDGWFYDPAQTGGTLWIKVPGAAAITIQ
jgi:alpha-D-xyloside xylohydrolase